MAMFAKNIRNFKTRLISRNYPENMVEKILQKLTIQMVRQL